MPHKLCIGNLYKYRTIIKILLKQIIENKIKIIKYYLNHLQIHNPLIRNDLRPLESKGRGSGLLIKPKYAKSIYILNSIKIFY